MVDIIADAATADSHWSRGPKGYECRIGDLTHAEAMEYLTVKRGIESHKAMKILDFCGPRILSMKDTCDRLETGTDLDSLSTFSSAGLFSSLTRHRIYCEIKGGDLGQVHRGRQAD